MFNASKKLLITVAASSLLAACGAMDRIANIGTGPDLKPMDQHTAPDRPASLGMPTVARPAPVQNQPASLWRIGSKAFFHDQRASAAGDIVTVVINIADQAQVSNSTSRSRNTSEGANIPAFGGLEQSLANSSITPDGFDPTDVIDFGSTSNNTGTGSIARSEALSLTVAAIVTQILPNGNFVIQGRQEVRVNFEVRELWITGIIRPEDISNTNTIQHTQIAEARISYGGRGQLTDMQQARYGQQLFEILFPF